MTVTLKSDIETRLRAYGDDLDLDPKQLAANLLTRAFEEAETELKETMDGLDRNVEDYNAGRWITSEELTSAGRRRSLPHEPKQAPALEVPVYS